MKSGIEFHGEIALVVTTQGSRTLVRRSSFREPHFGRFVQFVVVVGMEGFEPLVVAARGDVEVAQAGLQFPLPRVVVDAAVAREQSGEAGVDAALVEQLRGRVAEPRLHELVVDDPLAVVDEGPRAGAGETGDLLGQHAGRLLQDAVLHGDSRRRPPQESRPATVF